MRKLLLIVSLLFTSIAYGQCKKVNIISNMTEFYSIDIKENILYLVYNESGINSLMVLKGDQFIIFLENGEEVKLISSQTLKTKIIAVGSGLSRSEIRPIYSITEEDLKKLSTFSATSIQFNGAKQTVKGKKRKAKLMSLANCQLISLKK